MGLHGALSLILMFLFSLITFLLSSVTSEDGPKVKTTHGWLQGGYTTTRGGRRVVEFLGIPYAKPPVGELSFKSPVAHEPWNGVRNATTECPVCMQQLVVVEALANVVSGSEDCLCLNIFTPKVSPTAKLPVIFFIHGGAYMGLSYMKSSYGPEMLLDKDVVLVTVGYRLGVLGFLSTEDDVIPGNFGMKDQAAALRWMKNNIAEFGGDANSITLMGESSGATSVHLHMLSPLSKDLFQRGITHSGGALCQWASSIPGVIRNQSATVARLVGCPFTPSSALLTCLQKLPANKIVDTTHHFLVWDNDPLAFWRPTVEPTSVKDAFLTESPWQLSSDKPLLAGYNYAEGSMKICSITAGNVSQKFEQWNEQFDRITPVSLLYDHTAPNPKAVNKAVRDFYFGPSNKLITPNMTTQLMEMYGDFWFVNGILDGLEKHHGPKYLYHFNFNTSVSICSIYFNNPVYLGACHLDELMYLFPMDVTAPRDNPNSPDYKISVKMVELWTSFAKYSVPQASGVFWSPVRSDALEHLELSNDGITMKSHPIMGRREFWKSLTLRK